MTETKRRIETWAPWTAGLLLATPVLLAFYPPMTDLPFHEAAVGLLRHFDDPSMVPPGLYVRNLGEPNQLFHMLGWALSYAVSTRWAVKLIVAGAVVAIPVAGARFARHVGSSPIAALVIAPMALGWLFSWGLITNLIGVAALLAVLPELDRLADEPSGRAALRALGAVILLYFAHMAMMLMFAGVALGFAVLHPWSWKKSALRLSPLLAAAVVALAQLRLQKPFMSPAVRSMPRLWARPFVKLSSIPNIVLPATDRVVSLAMLGLCVLAIAGFFVHRGQERREARSSLSPAVRRLERLRSWALTYRWEIVAALGFAAYMTFPLTLNGATLVYQRWLPPAFAILAVVAAPRTLLLRRTRVACFAAFVLPAATLLVAGPSFADSDRHYRHLEEIIAQVAPGSSLAAIDLGPFDPTRGFSLGTANGRIMATRGGRLAYAFTDSSVSPVVLARRYQWTESLFRVAFDPWRFSPTHDLKRFRYVLVRTQDPRLSWIAAYALSDTAKLVVEAGEWALFESRLPVIPLTSPDAPLPDPPPETMRDLVHKVAMSLAQEPGAPQVTIPDERSPEAEGARDPAH